MRYPFARDQRDEANYCLMSDEQVIWREHDGCMYENEYEVRVPSGALNTNSNMKDQSVQMVFEPCKLSFVIVADARSC